MHNGKPICTFFFSLINKTYNNTCYPDSGSLEIIFKYLLNNPPPRGKSGPLHFFIEESIQGVYGPGKI